MNRLYDYLSNFIFNGVLLTVTFFLMKYAFLYFSPTSWYFEYASVEPVTIPVDITQDYIIMQSELINRQIGGLEWNDVLRCRDGGGEMSYVGQWDTHAETILISEDFFFTQWVYQGTMPTEPAICRMDSTITRHLAFGITKTQFIQSALFKIE